LSFDASERLTYLKLKFLIWGLNTLRDRVELTPIETGFEIVLIAPSGQAQQLQVIDLSEGNNFIAEIPNAQIEKPFRQTNPAEGIRQVAIAFSGSLLVFAPEIDEFLKPDEFRVTPQPEKVAIASILDTIKTNHTQPFTAYLRVLALKRKEGIGKRFLFTSFVFPAFTSCTETKLRSVGNFEAHRASGR
jgi:AMIN domain